jgi:hypothetical protein
MLEHVDPIVKEQHRPVRRAMLRDPVREAANGPAEAARR